MTSDFEDVVMTAARNNGCATIRLDRQRKSKVDFSKVHHEGGGPYTGILINKLADDLDAVSQAEGRIEFVAHLQENGQDVQDMWTIRFWFKGKTDGYTRKQMFTKYFQELCGPDDIPKTYIAMVKRALVLFRKYDMIRRIEMEVEQSDDLNEEISSKIKSFTTVFTPASYIYELVPEVSVSDKTFVTFMVKAAGDANIALSAVYGDLERKTYEIVIGADDNTRSYIRDCAKGPIKAQAKTYNILNEKEFKYFWISWSGNRLEVGKGIQYGYARFLSWDIPPNKQFNVNCLALATGRASKGQWEFAEILEETELTKKQKRNKIKISLIWIAKKQKMLTCLEEAYPNPILLEDLWRKLKVKQSDMITAVVMLRDLEKKGLIKELETGVWMRVQDEQSAQNEVKLVKEFPVLSGREQPTIGIITALYCEKLAVDAMMDEKTTFVKYKTEGESQVYTLGWIGKHKVVSTKLSRSGTQQEYTIAAENTITRLLGTFNRIDHVFVVGVGGAVPHYSDYKQHIRLGDIVVSKPINKAGAMYIHCQKIEKIEDAEGHKFTTRAYSCRNQSIQIAVETLKQRYEYEEKFDRPWDVYIEEGKEVLRGEESIFHRPPIKSDKLLFTKPDGSVMNCEHPRSPDALGREAREGKVNVSYGVVGSGRIVARAEEIRREFSALNGIKGFDSDFDCVMESLDGNRCDSYLVVRGCCDYADGTRKEWQPYASLVAAAYMKSVIKIL